MGFAESFALGAGVSQAQRKRKEDALQKKGEHIAAGLEAARTGTQEAIQKKTDLAVQLAGTGVDREDANFKALLNGIQADAMQYGSVLGELRTEAQRVGLPEATIAAIEDPNAFVENATLEANAAVDAAFAGRAKILPPEQLPEQLKNAVVQQDASGGLDVVFNPSEDQSELQQRAAMLQEAGVPEDIAKLTAAGGIATVINPADGHVDIVNKGTGETIFTSRQPPGEPAEVPPVVPTGIDVAAATGVKGMATNALNILSDAFNFGVPYKDAQEATKALKQIQTTTILELQAPIAGRPAKDIRENIKDITVKPNSFFSGPQGSLATFKQMLRFIDSSIVERQNALDTETMTDTQRGLLQTNVRTLETSKQTYTDLISSIEAAGADDLNVTADAAFDAAIEAGDNARANEILEAQLAGDTEALKKILEPKDDGGNP